MEAKRDEVLGRSASDRALEQSTSSAVPTPFAVGRVNCLPDRGRPADARRLRAELGHVADALEAGLAEHGRRVEDLERIVITHQHIDHIGLAQILADRSGAEVVRARRAGAVAGDLRRAHGGRRRVRRGVMRRHGIPDDVSLALRAVTSQFRGWGASVRRHDAAGRRRGAGLRRAHVDGAPPARPLAVGHGLPRRRARRAGRRRPPHQHISSNPLITRPLDAARDRPAPAGARRPTSPRCAPRARWTSRSSTPATATRSPTTAR